MCKLIHNYTAPELYVNFIDREYEIEKITKLVNGRLHVIAGPRGCGKTELFKALTYALRQVEDKEKYNIVFIVLRQIKQEYTQIVKRYLNSLLLKYQVLK